MKRSLSVLAFCLLASTTFALPSDPVTMRFQTRLVDTGGVAVHQAGLTATVRLYNSALGGVPFYTEAHTVDANAGLLGFDIGSVTALDSALLVGPVPVYVGVTIGTDSEMVPRVKLGAMPLAKHADSAAVADDVPGKNITPNSVTVNGLPVINAAGDWVGNPTGLTGPQGPAGAQGAVGPQGPQGLKGDTGSAGPQGAKGDTGATGAQGPKGKKGDSFWSETSGNTAQYISTGNFGSVQVLPGTTGSTAAPGAGGDTQILLSEDHLGERGMKISYNGFSDELNFNHKYTSGQSGSHLSITNTGEVKIPDLWAFAADVPYLDAGVISTGSLKTESAEIQSQTDESKLSIYPTGGGGSGGSTLYLGGDSFDVKAANLRFDAATTTFVIETKYGGWGMLKNFSIDAAKQRVGIGSLTPESPLDVQGIGTSAGGIAPYGEVIGHFSNWNSSNHTAVSIDAAAGKDPILYMSQNGAAMWDMRVDASGNDEIEFRFHRDSSGENAMRIRKSGTKTTAPFDMVQYGSVLPSHDANTDCTLGSSSSRWNKLYLANAPIVTSDERAKINIQSSDRGLDEILNLSPKRYDLITGDTVQRDQLGLLAQDLLKVIPEVVVVPEGEDELLGVQYTNLVPVLVQAIQDQQAGIDKRDALLEKQGEELASQEARIARLEALLTDVLER